MNEILGVKNLNSKYMALEDDDSFKQMLETVDNSNIKMGSNVMQLAIEHHFIQKLNAEKQRQDGGRNEIQEKISFVRMEYFLYAFCEAYRIMQELEGQDDKIAKIVQNVNKLERDK